MKKKAEKRTISKKKIEDFSLVQEKYGTKKDTAFDVKLEDGTKILLNIKQS